MPKIFVIFGKDHIHQWKGQRLGRGCVVIVEDAPSETEVITELTEVLNGQFCNTYDEEGWEWRVKVWNMLIPGGYITIPWEDLCKATKLDFKMPKIFVKEEGKTKIESTKENMVKYLKQISETVSVRVTHPKNTGVIETMKIFLTFGQVHVHHWKGCTLDKDCVVVVEDAPSEREARDALMLLFGGEFCTTYDEETWDKSDYIKDYPRGYITIPWQEIKEMVIIPTMPSLEYSEESIKEMVDVVDTLVTEPRKNTEKELLQAAFRAGASHAVKISVQAFRSEESFFLTIKDIREAFEEWYKNEHEANR